MELGANELHVWSVRLNGSDATVAAFSQLLPASERERCARFHFEIHRRRFAVSHGALRILLARYSGIPPQQIKFRYGHAGKPVVDDSHANLAFNMSHSGDLAVYAVARECELGVDVEQIRPMADLERVASHFFSEEECGDLFALPAGERTQAFFRCWTRKEAYIKALGEGLNVPLQNFRVTLLPDEPAALVYTKLEPGGDWQIHHLTPDPMFAGAVAYQGVRRELRACPIVEAEAFRNASATPAHPGHW